MPILLSTDAGYAALLAMLVVVPLLAVAAAVFTRQYSNRRDHPQPIAGKPDHAFPVIAQPDPRYPIPKPVRTLEDGPGVYHSIGGVASADIKSHIEAQPIADDKSEGDIAPLDRTKKKNVTADKRR